MPMNVRESEEMLNRAERSILSEARREILPVQLIRNLKNKGIDEYSIRAAIWILIDDGKVELTRDRKLISLV